MKIIKKFSLNQDFALIKNQFSNFETYNFNRPVQYKFVMNFLLLTGGLGWLLMPLLLLNHILPAGPLINENNSGNSVEIKILDSEYKVINTTKDVENSTVINIEISGIPNHDNLIAKLNKKTKQKHQAVYTVDQNGNKHVFSESGRQDGPESPISNYFTAVGTVLNSNIDSQLFVTGYDNKNGSPKLTYSIINIGNITFYLKPFHSSNSIDPNRQNFHLVEIDNQLEEHLNSEVKQILKRFRRTTNGRTDSYPQNTNKKPKKSCGIKLIFDYSSYLKMDKDIGKVNLLAKYYMGIINLVFRNTVFTKSGYANDESNKEIYTGYGLILCEVVIHQHDNDSIPYNRLGIWNYSQLKGILSQSLGHKDFCLVHLITNNIIEDKINGLASIGWIFTEHNVGATSFAAYQSYQLSGILNIVHEIGHNFGAYHDSKNQSINDTNCFPETGGSFIMNQYPLVTYGPNNFFFSPCSNKLIWKTIKYNRDHFIEIDGCKSCGNKILEEEEACDDSGPCCDQKTCRLKLGASCSPVHSGCCDSNCQVKPKESICALKGIKDLEFCMKGSFCDGVNAQCPEDRISFPDGTRCNNNEKTNGTCFEGFCRFNCSDGYQQCQCDSQYPCRMCCSSVESSSHCLPMLKLANDLIVSNGTHHGKCIDGEFVYHDEPTLITDQITPTTVPDDNMDNQSQQITPSPPTTAPHRPDDKDKNEDKEYFKYVYIVVGLIAAVIVAISCYCIITKCNKYTKTKTDNAKYTFVASGEKKNFIWNEAVQLMEDDMVHQ